MEKSFQEGKQVIKYSGAVILLLSVSGCLIFTNDPAADKAAENFAALVEAIIASVKK